MDHPSQGRGGLIADPIPYVRGLYQLIPEERLAAILSRTGRQSERRRRLPADSVAWLVIALALFAADSIPMVWRRLHPTLDHPELTDSAFSQARRRLGVAPLRALFLEVARPMATHQTIGAFYRGWCLMGIDGTTLDLPDSIAARLAREVGAELVLLKSCPLPADCPDWTTAARLGLVDLELPRAVVGVSKVSILCLRS